MKKIKLNKLINNFGVALIALLGLGSMLILPKEVLAVWWDQPSSALLLGEVVDANSSLYSSCPNQRKVIGGTCTLNAACAGSPGYSVTWSQNGDGATATSQNCILERSSSEPFYTFEKGNNPIGSPGGNTATVSVKVNDPNFKLTSWTHSATNASGVSCFSEQGNFNTPSSEQTIQIKAIRNGDCQWNHVWFTKAGNFSGTPPTASISGPASGTTTSNLSYSASAQGTNLRKVLIYYAKTTSDLRQAGSWTLVAEKANCAGASTCATSGSFRPPAAGDYYVVVNAQINDGNPFCSGNPANTGTPRCGNNDRITLRVDGAAPPDTLTPAPTTRTYQYRYSVGDACFNAGDASPAWTSFEAAGNTDTLSINNFQLQNPVAGKVYNVCVQFKKSDQTTGQVYSRQLSYVTPTATPTNTPTATPTNTSPPPTPTIPTYTTHYRCSEQSFDKDDAGSSAPQWEEYRNQDGSGAPVTYERTFTYNVVPGGNLNLFCQFKDNKGNKSTVTSKSIKYTGGQPRITSASCTFSPTGTGTLLAVRGINFGLHDEQGTGNIKVEGKEATISSWVTLGADSTSTLSATLSAIPARANNDIRYEIKSTLRDKLTAGRHQIVLTTDDGVVVNGYCSLDLTTVDFTQKTTCLAQSGDLSTTDVAVEIKEKAENARPLIKKKINTDREGKPIDFTPGVEVGKTYILNLKAPKTVSRRVEFVAEEGTTNLGDIILYVGDIYPVASPDNKVNAFDKGEMSREWALNSDVSRPADLNTDSRVNSVDYSCLQNNYNKGGE